MSRWLSWLAVPVAATVMACSASTSQPSYTISLANEQGDFGEYALLVYDETGLVMAGRRSDRRAQGERVTAFPERLELELEWTGGACSHRPILTLTGDATALRLELQPTPPEWTLPFVSCPAAGLPLGVTLSLGNALEQGALRLEVVR